MCPAQEASGGGQAPSLSRRQVVPQARQGTSERQDPAAGDGDAAGRGAADPGRHEAASAARARADDSARASSGTSSKRVGPQAHSGRLPGGLREDYPAGGVARGRGRAETRRVADAGRGRQRPGSPVVACDRGAPPRQPRRRQVGAADTVVAPVVDVVLPRLVNELDGQGEITLILDDFHRLSSVPARASVRWFIDHAPPGFQLVLATRTEPALPVAALRAHGELLELRADDLRFTCEEADAFLNGRLGARPHARRCRRPGREDGGMAGRALSRRALAAARCRPPRFRAQIRRLEPSRGRFPGDGGT